MSALLAASMIVRDEAEHLGACLASISGFVDKIVVVDTGSQDESVDIARRFGAEVHEITWRGDFAAARNVALARTQADWSLYIDADERLGGPPPDGLRQRLSDPQLAGCYVRLRAHREYRPYRELRLFRRHPLVRFEGAMHETIWPGLERYLAAVGGRIGDSDLILEHVGYEGCQEHKHARDLPLLQKRLRDDRDHVYSWWHLGRVYLAAGRTAEARAAWHQGVAAARRRSFCCWADSLVFAELIQLDFDDRPVRDALLDEAICRYPDHAYLVWLDGQRLMRDGCHVVALTRFHALVDWDARAHESDGFLGYPDRLFGAMALEGLASCCFRLGRLLRAHAGSKQHRRPSPIG